MPGVAAMNILVTLDANYIHPLRVMLKSLFFNHREGTFTIYLMHSRLADDEVKRITQFVVEHGHRLREVRVEEQFFKEAPTIKHYTKEMYYRLLAHQFLPANLNKVLYLDPDILVLNPIDDLYHLDLNGYMFAAACHRLPLMEINKFRLKPYDVDTYYNSGVLLMNLEEARRKINEKEIYEYVARYKQKLLLPDQDVINALYSKQIKTLDEMLYNYDPRYYYYYKMTSYGKVDMDYVIYRTKILHFCGKKKPWLKNYSGKFHSLYKHYEKMAASAIDG